MAGYIVQFPSFSSGKIGHYESRFNRVCIRYMLVADVFGKSLVFRYCTLLPLHFHNGTRKGNLMDFGIAPLTNSRRPNIRFLSLFEKSHDDFLLLSLCIAISRWLDTISLLLDIIISSKIFKLQLFFFSLLDRSNIS